jgi:hypothetical protein
MKLKYNCVAQFTRSKNIKHFSTLSFKKKINVKNWISATKIHNYILKDPLVDWLKIQNRKGTKSTLSYTNTGGFKDFIMKCGINFESEIVKYIKLFRLPVVSVSETITDSSCKKTISLMMEGTPVIHSAPVRNHKNTTHGIIDLLVRSDYLELLVDECPLTDEEKIIPALKLNGNYHYVVIDVKYSTLPLRADGRLLLNSGSYPAYKAQTLIYTQAIGNIQGYTSKYAYIMGRRWNYNSKDIKHHNYTCLNKLGVIDFEGIDKDYVNRTKEALTWVRNVNRYGHKWSVNPPSRPELYPNMCVDSGIWNKEKEKIAKRIGEITSVWYCGVKNREIGLSNDISSWNDLKCTSSSIGIHGTRAKIINDIIDINRKDGDKIRPQKILNNMYDWKKKGNEVFVDFETLSDIFPDFSHLPEQKSMGIIFMIGVGWEENKVWKYKSFICNHPTYTEEYRIMKEFNDFMCVKRYPQMYFWHAEKSFWSAAKNRQNSNNVRDLKLEKWADLSKLFRTEPIVIKDCFNFGLKNIAKSMRNYQMISACIESECNSGMTAMVNAWKCYKNSKDPVNSDTMKDIELYNEFDVKVLYQIIEYLRENHT